MKKNNTAEKNLLEAQALASALKEGTQKTLNQILNEAISDFMDNDEESDETQEKEEDGAIKDDSIDVEDVTTSETDEEDETEDSEESSDDTEVSDEEDEWSEKLKDYQVGDNEFDMTNVDDDTAFEVFSKVGDSDLVHITKQDDGTYEIKDDNSGAELVLDLNPDSDKDGDDDVETEFEIETENEPETDDEVDFGAESEDTDEEGENEEDDDEEVELDIEDDEEDELNENYGYTDDYQKDVFSQKFNMNEPANKNATYSMDGGVPTGAEKPWAGKNNDSDYEEVEIDLSEECENGECETELEENVTTSKSQKRKMVKTMAPNSGEVDKPEVTKVTSVAGNVINEAQVKKIISLSKTILSENKKYKESLEKIKKGLQEAYVTNVNYGRLVNILMNETTTKEEKRNIVERFKNVKSIEEGKTLTESIKRELNNSHKTSAPRIDEQISAASSKTINETVMFEQNPILNLMERMDRLPELNGVKKLRK